MPCGPCAPSGPAHGWGPIMSRLPLRRLPRTEDRPEWAAPSRSSLRIWVVMGGDVDRAGQGQRTDKRAWLGARRLAEARRDRLERLASSPTTTFVPASAAASCACCPQGLTIIGRVSMVRGTGGGEWVACAVQRRFALCATQGKRRGDIAHGLLWAVLEYAAGGPLVVLFHLGSALLAANDPQTQRGDSGGAL